MSNNLLNLIKVANYLIEKLRTPRYIHWLQVITGFAALLAISTYFLTFKPSLNITNAYFVVDDAEDITIAIGYELQNFGKITAYDAEILNHRIINISINEDHLKKLQVYERFKDANMSEKRKKRAFLDIKGRARSAIIDGLIEYLKRKPYANKEQVQKFLSETNSESYKELFKKRGLEIYEEPIFSLAECNNDMDKYFSGSSAYPPSPKPTLIWIAQEMGGGIKNVVDGKNILIVYGIVQCRGEIPFKEYKARYIGFYDQDISHSQLTDGRYPMNRYSIW